MQVNSIGEVPLSSANASHVSQRHLAAPLGGGKEEVGVREGRRRGIPGQCRGRWPPVPRVDERRDDEVKAAAEQALQGAPHFQRRSTRVLVAVRLFNKRSELAHCNKLYIWIAF